MQTIKENANNDLYRGASPQLFYYARLNRQAQTKAEKILWRCLRNRRLIGYKFRRQHPISDFIADFICMEKNLVVEIDGEYHSDVSQQLYDCGRTYEFE